VEFAKQQGIAIYARATAGPLPGADPSADGTVVRRHAPRMPGTVVGVASERDVLVLNVDLSRDAARPPSPAGSAASLGAADEVLSLLDEHRVAGKQLHVAGGRLTLVVSRENLHEEDRVRAALSSRFGDRVHVADHLGAISIVGAGINASFEHVRRGDRAFAEAGIATGSVATSSFRTTWMIDRARLEDAVRLLHRTFIEGAQAPVP
jgi:aspartate kinase